MSKTTIPYTFDCKVCGQNKTVEVIVPTTCSKECRVKNFGIQASERKGPRGKRIIQSNDLPIMENENQNQEPTQLPEEVPSSQEANEAPKTEETASVTNEPDANTTESTTVPTGETPEAPGSESAGDIGQGTPSEDRVDAPSQTAGDTGRV